MSTVLYRKYRARRFADIRGQDVVITVLKNSILNGKISHAYLFAGPRGTGKTSMARLLAAAVNFEGFKKMKDIDPESQVSQSIEKGKYLDLIEIDAASNRGIEEIRQLREGVNYRPSQGAYKVYIIDEVHMLTREAFNALLKTLEEPPSHVVFVLATTEPHKVPDTILSRVQRFDFRPATESELVDKLKYILDSEEVKHDPEGLSLLHKYSGGSFRDAESLLGKILMGKSSGEKITVTDIQEILGLAPEESASLFITSLLEGDALGAISVLSSIRDGGVDLRRFAEQITQEVRDRVSSQAKSGNNYSSELLLLRKLIQARADFRLIDDAYVLLELMVYEISQKLNPNTEKTAIKVTPKVETKKDEEVKKNIPKPALSVPKKLATLDHPKVQKIVTDSPKLLDVQRKEFLAQVKSKDFKVWAHLKVSDLENNSGVVIITTKYKKGIEQLRGALGLLEEASAKVYGDEIKIELNLDSVANQSLSNEEMVESMF